MLTALGIVACSSADTPEGDDEGTGGSSGSGGSATGGSAPTGGTASGGTATGGTSSGGTSTGGSATGGTGGTDGPNIDPECKGIKSNGACTLEGKACPNLVCGLADSGRRECNCATTWSCTTCNYDNSPFKDRPADIPACPTGVGDEVPCTELNAVCGPSGSEYCACYQDATDGLIWDCDSPPSSWM
jgi:hypothetical protein